MEPGKLPRRRRLGQWALAVLLLIGAPAGMITAQQLADRGFAPRHRRSRYVA